MGGLRLRRAARRPATWCCRWAASTSAPTIGGWAGAGVGVLCAAAMALVVHVAVFRPLRSAPALARVVASVGVAMVLQALAVLRFGTTRRAVPSLLPNDPVEVGSITFSVDRLWLAGIAVAFAVLLWAYGRFTRTGLATRAAARGRAGRRPPRLRTRAAGRRDLGARLRRRGAVAVLASPTVGLEPISWTLLVVPALACALVGRLDSVGVACAAGLVLGAIQSEITLLSARTWWPDVATVGVAQSVPFIVIMAALFLLGRSLPDRGSAKVDPLPPVPVPRPDRSSPLPSLASAALAVLLTEGTYRFGVITSMIVALIALSLVVLTGLVGQISLAQAAFAGAAGFTLSKIGTTVPFPFSMLLGRDGGHRPRPARRRPGPARAGGAACGRDPGGRRRDRAAGVPQPRALAGHAATTSPTRRSSGSTSRSASGTEIARWQFGFLVLGVLALAAAAVANLARSATGRALLAVRSNERAAAAAGVDVARGQAVRLRPLFVPRRTRRLARRLQPRPAFGRLLRRRREPQRARLRLPRRHHQRGRRGRGRHPGPARHRLRRPRAVVRAGRPLSPGVGPPPARHRRRQPRRHRRPRRALAGSFLLHHARPLPHPTRLGAAARPLGDPLPPEPLIRGD